MPGSPFDANRLDAALRESRILYMMPYGIDEFRLVTQMAHERDVVVAIDIEATVAPDRERLETLLALSDIVFMNEGGYRATHEGEVTETALCALLAHGPRLVVATLGARGAVAVTAQAAIRRSAFPARVVDATGAGDCFNGAFLAALVAERDVGGALDFAAAAASFAVSEMGARSAIPSISDVERLLAKVI